MPFCCSFQNGKPHSDDKVFRDDLILPPAAPLGYDSLSKERGHWMAWDPAHEIDLEDDDSEAIFADEETEKDDDILDSWPEEAVEKTDDSVVPVEEVAEPEQEEQEAGEEEEEEELPRSMQGRQWFIVIIFLKAKFMGPTWGPPGADRTQVDPMLVLHEPWYLSYTVWSHYSVILYNIYI